MCKKNELAEYNILWRRYDACINSKPHIGFVARVHFPWSLSGYLDPNNYWDPNKSFKNNENSDLDTTTKYYF